MWTRRLFELTLFGWLLSAGATAAAQEAGTEDSLEHYRERFKLGMERYKLGALAEAVGYWEPIYRELGEQKGYRLAYDLGVAYAELGDATRAAERLQSFLAEVAARRARGEAIAPIVEKEETLAQARIDGLVTTKGRIVVEGGATPRAARVDAQEPRLAGFVAWVTPGEHTVIFGPGTPEAETKTVEVHAGEIVEVRPAPDPAPPPPLAPVVSAEPSSLPLAALAPPVLPLASEHPSRRNVGHPFSPAFIAVGGGLTVAAGVAAGATLANAWTLRNRFTQQGYARTQADYQSFGSARTWAYVTVGGAVALATITAGLAAWYFLGGSTPDAGRSPEGNGRNIDLIVTPGGVAGRFP
jgi:hypothetical protein